VYVLGVEKLKSYKSLKKKPVRHRFLRYGFIDYVKTPCFRRGLVNEVIEVIAFKKRERTSLI
jgi:hypothetical protein